MSRSSLVIGIILLVARSAGAQSSCSGALDARLGLSQPDASGAFIPIADAMVAHTFSAAECECDTSDIQLDIDLAAPLSGVTSGSAEVWVGQGCDDYQTRSSGSDACEKAGTINFGRLTGNAPSTIRVPLRSRGVFSPVKHDCTAAATVSRAYLIVYADPALPLGTCTLPLSPRAEAPAVAAQIAALTRAGDGSVSVSITPPPSDVAPLGFQLLCATTEDEPFGHGEAPMYSVCPGRRIERRGIVPIAPAGTLTTFDTAYVCSDMIAANATRVNLPWLRDHDGANFLLLTVDEWGNFAPSITRSISAAPSRGPIAPAHGCSFAPTGSTGSRSPVTLFLVLVGLGLSAWRRRNLTV
jgi:MYXO-CTERM domain-containing protein